MTTHTPIVLIHSAGPQGSLEGSDYLLRYLRTSLPEGYQVVFPDMPHPDNPSYVSWRKHLRNVLRQAPDNTILIGHSLGGSVLLKYLAEEQPDRPFGGLFLIAAPYWGMDNWDVAEYAMPTQPLDLRGVPAVYLYHSKHDTVVPVQHLLTYQRQLPQAIVRTITGEEHLFSKGLPVLIDDIESLKPVPIEIFTTNLNDPVRAAALVSRFHESFPTCVANVDLEDCDRIFRVRCTSGLVQPARVIAFLHQQGYEASVLPEHQNLRMNSCRFSERSN